MTAEQIKEIVDILAREHSTNMALFEAAIQHFNEFIGEKSVIVNHGYGAPENWLHPDVYILSRSRNGTKSFQQLAFHRQDSPVRMWYLGHSKFVPYTKITLDCIRRLEDIQDSDLIESCQKARESLMSAALELLDVRLSMKTGKAEVFYGLDVNFLLQTARKEGATNLVQG
jgi:hypothetical protein